MNKTHFHMLPVFLMLLLSKYSYKNQPSEVRAKSVFSNELAGWCWAVLKLLLKPSSQNLHMDE